MIKYASKVGAFDATFETDEVQLIRALRSTSPTFEEEDRLCFGESLCQVNFCMQ